MDTIYLIEQTWIDNVEDRKPWGYSPIGFVETLKEAENIVSNGGRHKIEDCWRFEVTSRCMKELPPTIYKYTEIKNIKSKVKNNV